MYLNLFQTYADCLDDLIFLEAIYQFVGSCEDEVSIVILVLYVYNILFNVCFYYFTITVFFINRL